MLAIAFPAIDPVAVEIGPVAIRWYALSYVVGILLGWAYMARVVRLPPRVMTRAEVDDFVVWVTLGVILGGRLGYVFFYNPAYFVDNPLEILAMWQGGMSFHGGLLGVCAALYLFARQRGLDWRTVGDYLVCAIPIGLLLGRLANFINGELYGRVTDVSWAMVFPGGGPDPRHPSQLYEAFLEGALLFAVLAWLAWRTKALQRPGLIGGVFLSGYGISRFVVEFFREPDAHLGFLFAGATMGQVLSVPLIVVGLWLILKAPMPGEASFRSPLHRSLRRRIAKDGPLPVSEYMEVALADPEHGYYKTRDPLGRDGDFTTSPEISQTFGELIGAWAAVVWDQMEKPGSFRLVELGPGRGTLMADALRAASNMPGFLEAMDLHLVEMNPALRKRQAETLKDHDPEWHETIDTVPDGPAILIANEFFDALPVDQYVRTGKVWKRRGVGLGGDQGFAFTVLDETAPSDLPVVPAKRGDILEVGYQAQACMTAFAARIALQGGAMLVVDYGHAITAVVDTLQAVADHGYADPLDRPGEVDLTTHVDFGALQEAAQKAGAEAHGPITQRDLLQALGIQIRRDALADSDEAVSAIDRLIDPDGMGSLFKAIAVTPKSKPVPPGFDK